MAFEKFKELAQKAWSSISASQPEETMAWLGLREDNAWLNRACM